MKRKLKFPNGVKGLIPRKDYEALLLIKVQTGKSISSLIRLGVKMVIQHYTEHGGIDE
jgi:hypothetical protein